MRPRLAVLTWNLALALAVAAGAILLVLRADHDGSKAATIALAVPIGLAFVASDLLVELGRSEGPRELRDAVSRALRDHSLEVAYQVEENGLVDTEGRALELPSDESDRLATFVERDVRCVATLIHDASLADEQELIAAVSAAGALALEKARSLQELRASEARNRALLDAIPDLMFRIARDGTYLDARADEEEDLTAPVKVARGSSEALGEVRDNGVGGASADRGSGLRGLADRVSALGGRLRVEGEAGAGTFIRAEIPLATVEPATG